MTGKSVSAVLQVTHEQVAEYWNIFVNRRAYVQQSDKPGIKSGRHYYFKPTTRKEKLPIPLELSTIAAHIAGRVTVGLYAINPETQASKWLAIDADYEDAIRDLGKLREAFATDGIEALLEASRRGGHLWVFAEDPLPAAMLRLYALNKATALGIPIKVKGDDDGIEVFPKQDSVGKGEYGNAIRAPFGIHRATGLRYWFDDAPQNIVAQFELVRSAKRLSLDHLERLTAGLTPINPAPFQPRQTFDWANGRIAVVSLGKHRRSGKNYVAACPVCEGNDPRGHHLSVKVADTTVYHCWMNCMPEEIKRALGIDPHTRLQFAA